MSDDSDTYRQLDRQTGTKIETNGNTYTQADRQPDQERQTNKDTNTRTERDRDNRDKRTEIKPDTHKYRHIQRKKERELRVI